MLYAVPRIWQTIYHDMQRELAREPEMSRHMFDAGPAPVRAKQQRGEHSSLSERVSLNLAEQAGDRQAQGAARRQLRLAFSGAAPLSLEVAEFMHDVGITIYEGYGLTESSGSSTTNPTARRALRLGRQSHCSARASPSSAARTGHDPREGEIMIYGPGVMAGYHNQPDETERVLGPDGGLRTGDLGYLDDDGYLYITGRVKELYKLNNGRYVAPAPLEEKLKLSPFIAQLHGLWRGPAVQRRADRRGRARLAGYFGARRSATCASCSPIRRVRRLYEDEILKHSKDFRTFELVRTFGSRPSHSRAKTAC